MNVYGWGVWMWGSDDVHMEKWEGQLKKLGGQTPGTLAIRALN